MQRPLHTDAIAHAHPHRAMTVTVVVAVHVIAIYGLIAALVPQARIPIPRGPIELLPTRIEPTKPQPAPPPFSWAKPVGPNVPAPPIPFEPPSRGSTSPPVPPNPLPPQQSGIPPRAIASTHTTPPYPLSSLRLGEQGTVRLLLMVGGDGTVVNATVEKTSGSYALDQAAIDWVRKHWRYHPGLENGAPVARTTEADIRFDIRNAR